MVLTEIWSWFDYYFGLGSIVVSAVVLTLIFSKGRSVRQTQFSIIVFICLKLIILVSEGFYQSIYCKRTRHSSVVRVHLSV